MKVIKVSRALESKEIPKALIEGKIFVYPTDTLYGIGCNAEISESVKKIYQAKNRSLDKPFSVIVPSKEWIFKNTKISKENKRFVESLLPGPYTVILKVKKRIPFVVSKEKTIGIRIPKNEFCDLIRRQNILFVTTSVNLTEEEPVFRIEDIPPPIRKIVDFAIDAGEIKGYASRVFDLTKGFEIARF
jgi:L-threonylcarbamoyladenylate synthase